MTTPENAAAVDELRRLRAASDAAAKKAADAAARADAAAASERARREARLREWDERTLADFDQQTLSTAAKDALDAVHHAVVSGGDVLAAWLAYQVAHRRMFELTGEANAVAARLGREQRGNFVSSVQEDLGAVVKAAISREAHRSVADDLDARAAARDAYVDGE